jgi:hypothetical protein
VAVRRPLLILTAAGACALLAAGLGLGASSGPPVLKLSVKLDSRQETPPPKGAVRTAAGLFTATLSNRTLRWRLVFSGLTGKAVAAHVHLGRRGVAGPVAVPLCGPCRSGAQGTVIVTPKVRSALTGGTAYVNVHTAKNPAGEIRGQVGGSKSAAPARTTTTGTTTTGTTTDGGYGGYG